MFTDIRFRVFIWVRAVFCQTRECGLYFTIAPRRKNKSSLSLNGIFSLEGKVKERKDKKKKRKGRKEIEKEIFMEEKRKETEQKEEALNWRLFPTA